MSSPQDLSQLDPAEIKHSIAETRSGLLAKLESLETEVKSEVNGAKSFVQQKVEDVKSAFDVRNLIGTHPLASVGTALFAGWILDQLIPVRRSELERSARPQVFSSGESSVASYANEQRQTAGEASSAGVLSRFEPEIAQLKLLGLEAIFSPMRQIIKSSLSEGTALKAEQVLDDVIRKI